METETSKEEAKLKADEPRHRTRSRSPPVTSHSKHPRTRSPPPRKPNAPVSAPSGPKTSNGSNAQSNSATNTGPSATDKMDIDKPKKAGTKKITEAEDEDEDTIQMKKMMGFGGFKSTKNTKVPGNDIYAVRKEKKTEYRQYMNRVGGFNRPLSPGR